MASVMSLEDSMEATLRDLQAQLQQWRDQPFTIFRVPAYVRESNPTVYEPRMVSIGPYYHGNVALRAMEDHKWRYLHDLLSRDTAVSSSLLIQEIRSLESRARACYSERPTLGSDEFVRMLLLDGSFRSLESRARACYSERPTLGSDEFVRMLLLDGSFVLEFFFKWHAKCPDKLCDAGWGRTLITSDLLLLENQIPFFVVEKLYLVIAGAQGGSRETLFNLFLEYMISQKDLVATPSATTTVEIHHLLHLLYESVVPKRSRPAGSSSSSEVRVIPRATEMSAAGVTFIRRRRSNALEPEPDMYDVMFDDGRGVMEIPAVVIDDMMRPRLINLIAFEQSQGGEQACVVMSYVNLMSMLVRTAEDVELLRRCGILENLLADDEAAARFFSHLGDGSAMNYERHIFSVLYGDVDRYCGSWWHRNMAALRRDYFGSPWSAIAFVVAGLVVALTATQTYFTVFPSK